MTDTLATRWHRWLNGGPWHHQPEPPLYDEASHWIAGYGRIRLRLNVTHYTAVLRAKDQLRPKEFPVCPMI